MGKGSQRPFTVKLNIHSWFREVVVVVFKGSVQTPIKHLHLVVLTDLL